MMGCWRFERLLPLLLLLLRWQAATSDAPLLWSRSAVDAVRRLRRVLPYDAAACGASGLGPADRVGCAERLLVERIEAWLEWHVPFRREVDRATCARRGGRRPRSRPFAGRRRP